jgi:hypothetical protein
LPSTVTTPVVARVPNDQAALIKQHARRFGLSTSQAIAVLIDRGLNPPPSPTHDGAAAA